MRLWRRLVWVIDPAQGYFDRQDGVPARTSAPKRGALTYGPGVPGGSRAATEAERADLARRGAQTRPRRGGGRAAGVAEVKRRWGDQVQRAAEELIAHDVTHLVVADGRVQARIVRFWRGDHVLHIVREAPGSSGQSITRLPRRRLHDGAVPLLEDYLASALAD